MVNEMEIVKIMNPIQVAFYLENKVKPIDIVVGYQNRLVYIFDKEDTKNVWELWKQACIEYKAKTY